MGSHEVNFEVKLKRFLYTNSYHGVYVTGNPDKHFCKLSDALLFQWVKSSQKDFLKVLTAVNEDVLLTRRANLFYILAEALHDENLPISFKLEIKDTVLKLIKSDEEFFDFIKYFTSKRTGKQKISTGLKKIIIKFYQEKLSLDFAKSVTRQESYHGWTHKDLIKLCHFKCETASSEPVVKYVLFGTKELPEVDDPASKTMIDLLKKSHELRTTEDIARAVALMKELHATVDRVNSKLNKKQEVWLAAIPEMSTRDVLQSLYRFYKLGFFKSGSQFQAKIIEALTNTDKIKKCNLHPVEVFIYLKFFEKGGKTMDPKLLDYLQKQEIKEDTLKRLTTPSEPKCKGIIQNISKCLMLSYNNVQPTGKKFMVTVDVTEKAEEQCFHNKRITCLEATHALIRYLSKVEKNVTVAVFKDSQVSFVDLSKSHSAIEKLQEHKASYIVPSAPLEWARNKKKQVDVFINFMGCNWFSSVPQDIREKMEKLPESLHKYSKKMKSPNTRLVKVFLGGTSAAFSDGSKNILTIAGFSVDVPRVLEAFCRGNFC